MPDLSAFAPESIPFLALPWKRLHDRKHLPTCAAIYFVCDASSKVLYIGQTIHLLHRWFTHHRLSQCLQVENCRIAWLEITDQTLLPAIEEACIRYFRPPWNGPMPQGSRRLHYRRSIVRKTMTSIRLTPEARRLLNGLATNFGVSQAAILELLIRQKAQEECIQ